MSASNDSPNEVLMATRRPTIHSPPVVGVVFVFGVGAVVGREEEEEDDDDEVAGVVDVGVGVVVVF